MWAQVVNIALGVWLIAAPELLHFGGASFTNSRIAGPLVIVFSALAVRAATRPARFLTLLPALWLLATPIAFRYTQPAPIVSNIVAGLALIVFVLIARGAPERIGGGWRALFDPARATRQRPPGGARPNERRIKQPGRRGVALAQTPPQRQPSRAVVARVARRVGLPILALACVSLGAALYRVALSKRGVPDTHS